MAIDRYAVSGQSIEVGAATAAELTLELNNSDGKWNNVSFEGKELFAKVGYDVDGATEWLPLGYFAVDETPRKLLTISLSALDRMVLFDK